KCAKNLASVLRFLPSGRRFGPYFCSRAEASGGARPCSASVASRSTTSARESACQAATSLSVVDVTVLLQLANARTAILARRRERYLVSSAIDIAGAADLPFDGSRQRSGS